MKLSVVILNYNVRYFLHQCIVSVQRATKNIEAEIIVIDNASPDDSCKMVKECFPNITLIENKENVGFSKANNQAVKVAKGEYVCVLNPDTAVAEGTFEKCLGILESSGKIGAIGVYLLDGTGNFLPESKRNVPTPFISLLKILGLTKKYYASDLSEEATGSVSVLVGAFMFLKRSVYNQVGGFDEDYFMYGEDIDFSYKIEQAGYKNHYIGSTETLHYKGESTQKDAAYLDRFYGAMEIFYKKHFNSNQLLNTSVKIGVSLAKKLKGSSSEERKTPAAISQKAIVLTENLQLLKILSEKIKIPLTSSSKTIFQETELTNTLFIFDVDYMPYHQIFMVMKKFKNKNNQFRIRPPGCNFIIGSDKSDEKGSVLVF
ncbi:glycosyltransferase family 2 protein [Marixanthomonas ophiurae]|uniref:Glycosyltransferase family 2 protein n=1 Tax=Marixanthomonas ophiurae TaxID=387659 RepID=A0A3E1Q663_9FLAO|nr:glycosyltransferase family 2 protein [Marixanthomonas ophiurae]RFN57609.1 glycosyltransferase family 2 protein [Marixanthomonas ophiurae]